MTDPTQASGGASTVPTAPPPGPGRLSGTPAAGGPAQVLCWVTAGISVVALALYLWVILIPPVFADRSRVENLANPGQVVTTVAPVLLLGALAASMALGLRWRVALGAALAYFPAMVWPVGPFVLTEYPEAIRSVDANRWWAWSLVLASLALLVGVAALVADRLDRPSGSPVGSPGAPVDRRPPATTELLAASGAVLVLVVSWFLRRADAVYPSGEVSTGTLLYRDWPETGDGIVLVASIFGALITVAALGWVLGAPASRPGAAARRAEVWFGAATGLALDLLVRALSFGNLVRPELYGDAPATFEVPTSSVSLPGLVLVVVAAAALGVAGWTAAQRSGSGGSTPVDATT